MIQKRPADRFSSLHEFLSRFRSVRIFTGRPRPAGGTRHRLLVIGSPRRTRRLAAARLRIPAASRRRPRELAMAKDPASMPSPNEHASRPSRRRSTRWRRASPRWRPSTPRTGPAGDTTKIAEQIRRLRRELAALKREIYSQPRPLADRPGLAASSSGPQTRDYIDLIFDQFVELHGDRAIGDDQAIVTGPGPPRRPQGHVRRPPEGEEPRRADGLQLRLRPPRRLSQGAGEDAAGRQVRPADRHVHRHARRLSGHRRRGAGPGGDHRREPDGDEPDRHARSSAS